MLLLIASFGALPSHACAGRAVRRGDSDLVYAGAISPVLFLFVDMLLPRRTRAPGGRTPSYPLAQRAAPFGAFLAVVLASELGWALTQGGESGAFAGGSTTSVAAIGRSLFTDYAFAFEVTSVLILVAMVGAVVLAQREKA